MKVQRKRKSFQTKETSKKMKERIRKSWIKTKEKIKKKKKRVKRGKKDRNQWYVKNSK